MINSRIKQCFFNNIYSNAINVNIKLTNFLDYFSTISNINSRILPFFVVPFKQNDTLVTMTVGAKIWWQQEIKFYQEFMI